MLVISATNYSDFKTLANSLRHLDAVFFNPSVSVLENGGQVTVGVAYAFDYERAQCVFIQSSGVSLNTSDFPSAVQIVGHLSVSGAGIPAESF